MTIGDNNAATVNACTLPIIPAPQQVYTATLSPLTLYQWHCCFGHHSEDAVQAAHKNDAVYGLTLDTTT
ncbi:hypothetical protein FRB91_005867 [Serendipita sp. 411]|nr:hypothetical protein FRB91_005867 [Serendipita sp. 411]